MKITYLRERPLRSCVAALVLVPALFLIGCDSSSSDVVTGRQTIDGSGVLALEDRQITGFTRVSFADLGEPFFGGLATLHVQQGAQEALRVEAELTHAGLGRIDVVDLVVPQLSLKLAGVGELDVTNLNAQTLDATLVGIGGIHVVITSSITGGGSLQKIG